MELLSSGTAFYLNGQNLYGLKSTPVLGGTREKKEITNLLDTAHRYIAGLYKYDDLTFDFYYNSSESNPGVQASQVAAAFRAARAVELSGSSVWMHTPPLPSSTLRIAVFPVRSTRRFIGPEATRATSEKNAGLRPPSRKKRSPA